MAQNLAKGLILMLCTLGLLYGDFSPVAAADILVGVNGCGLIEAITAANTDQPVGTCPAGSGADKLILQSDAPIGKSNNTDFGGGNALPTITSVITIDGQGHTISRQTVSPVYYRLVSVAQTGTLNLAYVTITKGLLRDQPGAYGAGIYNRGRLGIIYSTMTDLGNAGGLGGAIYNEGTLSIHTSTISGNWSTVNGGALYNKGGTVTILGSTFSNNSAAFSEGSDLYNEGGTVVASASIFAN